MKEFPLVQLKFPWCKRDVDVNSFLEKEVAILRYMGIMRVMSLRHLAYWRSRWSPYDRYWSQKGNYFRNREYVFRREAFGREPAERNRRRPQTD